MLRQYYEDIQMFYEDATASFLILS
jgi:hypothetical protein